MFFPLSGDLACFVPLGGDLEVLFFLGCDREMFLPLCSYILKKILSSLTTLKCSLILTINKDNNFYSVIPCEK